MLLDATKKDVLTRIRILHDQTPDVLSNFEIDMVTRMMRRIELMGGAAETTSEEWEVVTRGLADLEACVKIDAFAQTVQA
jgi:hypothetical protein